MNPAIASDSLDHVPQATLLASHRCGFSIAGVTVDVVGDSSEFLQLGAQLLPFRAAADDPDIEIQVGWASRLAPSRQRDLFHSGCVWKVYEGADEFLFDFSTERFGEAPYKCMRVDRDFKHAQVLLNRECLSDEHAGCALEYPLDELLVTHYLSLNHGVEFHACGVVQSDCNSFLFLGHSGAGKSTTARLWSRHLPVEVLSDDRIIVRPCGSQFRMYGTPWHGEAAFASPNHAAVNRIFLLKHGARNHLQKLSRSAAVGELLARSFVPFYQPRFVEPVLALLEQLVENVPCYCFEFVPDRTAVEMILEFRD